VTAWVVRPAPAAGELGGRLLAEYLDHVGRRWFLDRLGRPATDRELAEALSADALEDPAAGLTPPQGAFFVGWPGDDGQGEDGKEPGGCVGVRLLDAGTAELKRLYVRPAARRTGGGTALLGAAERWARESGAQRIVLDTRRDLGEAVALYRRAGFAEIPAYGSGPYREVWLGKELG
jgi:GNAT superfamily N-acetyltransferase